LRGNETILDAFDTALPAGMDEFPGQPISQIVTVTSQHELPFCTSPLGPVGNGLQPGSAE